MDYAQIASVHDDSAVNRADSLGLDVTKAEMLLGQQLPTLDEVIDRLVIETNGGVNA